MSEKDFLNYIKELQNFYGQELSSSELKIWYENLKFMKVKRFSYILAQIYKTSKFMPKLSEILLIHSGIPYTAFETEKEDIKEQCNKCNDTGYVLYVKTINKMSYNYVAVCNCGRKKRYDGQSLQDPKLRSNYYIPTLVEIGLKVETDMPTKQQVKDSLKKIKNSFYIPDTIKEIIRREYAKLGE